MQDGCLSSSTVNSDTAKRHKTKTDYVQHQHNKGILSALKKDLSKIEMIQEKVRDDISVLQKDYDKNLGKIVEVKRQIQKVKKKIDEIEVKESKYAINLREELLLYEYKIIFENTVLLREVLCCGRMKTKNGLTWGIIFEEIDPIEVYVLLKLIILRQSKEHVAHIIGGVTVSDVDIIKSNAFSRMRKMTIFDKIYL